MTQKIEMLPVDPAMREVKEIMDDLQKKIYEANMHPDPAYRDGVGGSYALDLAKLTAAINRGSPPPVLDKKTIQ